MKTKIIGMMMALLLSACVPLSPSPTETPSAEATIPIPGDLGFGKISGKVTDAATGLPISNATVKCEHFSYTSREKDRCHGGTMTDQDGTFFFENVFFHDTDTITLIVEAAGYKSTSGKYASFTLPLLEADIQLSK